MKNDRLFWIGLLVHGFILWGWVDSQSNKTGWSYKWGRNETYRGFGMGSTDGVVKVWAGRPYNGMFSRGETGWQFFRSPMTTKSTGIGPLMAFVIDTTNEERPMLFMTYWGLFFGFLAVWYVGLIFRQKRRLSRL